MNNYKKIILIFCIIVCSCISNDDAQNTTVEFTTIGKGDLNGSENIEKSNVIVSNSTQWNDLLVKIGNSKVSNLFTETNIDFNDYQVIAVFDKVYTNGGNSIDITSVYKMEIGIGIKIENLAPGGVNSVITQPFHVVKIKKTNSQIFFKRILQIAEINFSTIFASCLKQNTHNSSNRKPNVWVSWLAELPKPNF